jgi:serine/threonine-protein kinase HipA
MVFTVLIGNSDAHGKNLSLLLDPPGRVRLAPLYDTVPTMLLGHLRVRCAMGINGRFASLEEVEYADLVAEMRGRFRWRRSQDEAARSVDQWVERVVEATRASTGAVADYVRARVDRLVATHRRGG